MLKLKPSGTTIGDCCVDLTHSKGETSLWEFPPDAGAWETRWFQWELVHACGFRQAEGFFFFNGDDFSLRPSPSLPFVIG